VSIKIESDSFSLERQFFVWKTKSKLIDFLGTTKICICVHGYLFNLHAKYCFFWIYSFFKL